MNTLYTITINRRKYCTTDLDECKAFVNHWELTPFEIKDGRTTEKIPKVIAL